MKLNRQFKFFLSSLAIITTAAITSFLPSYSNQTNKLNFISPDPNAPKALPSTTNLASFGVGVVPTSRAIFDHANPSNDLYLEPTAQESPLQLGYMDSNWFSPSNDGQFGMAYTGTKAPTGQQWEFGDTWTIAASELSSNQFNYMNNSSMLSMNQIHMVDLTGVDTLTYNGEAPTVNQPVSSIFYANPVLGSYSVVNGYPDNKWLGSIPSIHDTDVTTPPNFHFTTPYSWPDSASTPSSSGWQRKGGGFNAMNMCFPYVDNGYLVPSGSPKTYSQWRTAKPTDYFTPPGAIYPTQLDLLSEDVLNYAARYNGNAGYTNSDNEGTTQYHADRKGRMFAAEAANSNHPTFYKPSWIVNGSVPSQYNTMKEVRNVNITDPYNHLTEIGFNCFGGQYRYSGYYDGISTESPYINVNSNQKIKHSFTDPTTINSVCDDWHYKVPDAFTSLSDVKISATSITRIHSGAFFGGLNPLSDSTKGRESLSSVDLTGSPIVYMDNNNGRAFNDKDDLYWSTHCPTPDFSPKGAKKGDPDFMGGVFENNPMLSSITLDGKSNGINKNSLKDIPSRCFYGDSDLTGLKYAGDDDKDAITDKLPDSVEYIGDSAFNYSGWDNITLPNNPNLKLDKNFLGGTHGEKAPKSITFTDTTINENDIANLLTDGNGYWNDVFPSTDSSPFTIYVPWQTSYGNDISQSPYHKALADTLGKTVSWKYVIPFQYKVTGGVHYVKDGPMEGGTSGSTKGMGDFVITAQIPPNANANYLKYLYPEFCDVDGNAFPSGSTVTDGWSFSVKDPVPLDDSLSFYINYDKNAVSIDQPVYVRAKWDSHNCPFDPPDSSVLEKWAHDSVWKSPGGFKQPIWSINSVLLSSPEPRSMTSHTSFSDNEPALPTIKASIVSTFHGDPGITSWTPTCPTYNYYPVDSTTPIPHDGFPAFLTHETTQIENSSGKGTQVEIAPSVNRSPPLPGKYVFNIVWEFDGDSNDKQTDTSALYTIYMWDIDSTSMTSTNTHQSQTTTHDSLTTGQGLAIAGLGLSFDKANPTIKFNATTNLTPPLPNNSKTLDYKIKTTLDTGSGPQSHDRPAWLTDVTGTDPNTGLTYDQLGFASSLYFTEADVGTWKFTLTLSPANYDITKSSTLEFTFSLAEVDGFTWGLQGSKTWGDNSPTEREAKNTSYSGPDLVWSTCSTDSTPVVFEDTVFTVNVTNSSGSDVTYLFFPSTPSPDHGILTLNWTTTTLPPDTYTIFVHAQNDTAGAYLNDSPIEFDVWGIDSNNTSIIGGPSNFLFGKYFNNSTASSTVVPDITSSLTNECYLTHIAIIGNTGALTQGDLSGLISVTYSVQGTTKFAVTPEATSNYLNNFRADLSWNATTVPTTKPATYSVTATISTSNEGFTTQPTSGSVNFISKDETIVDDKTAINTYETEIDKSVLTGQNINKTLVFRAASGTTSLSNSDCTWTLNDDTIYTDQGQTKLKSFVDFSNQKGDVYIGTAPTLAVEGTQKYSFHVSFVYKIDQSIYASETYVFSITVHSAASFSTDWSNNVFDRNMQSYQQINDKQTSPLWNMVTTEDSSQSKPDHYGYGIYSGNTLISYFGKSGDGIGTLDDPLFHGTASGFDITQPEGTGDDIHALLYNNGVNPLDPAWRSKNLLTDGKLDFQIVVFGLADDGTIVADYDNSPTATINFSQITQLKTFNFSGHRHDINVNSTDSVSTEAPDFSLDCNPSFSLLSTDRTKSNFFLKSSNNANDFDLEFTVLKNGSEVSREDLANLYPKLSFSQNADFSSAQYFGIINFGIIEKLTKDEQAKYKGTWQVVSTLTYQQWSSPTASSPLSVQSNAAEFDLNPPSHTGIVVGMIAGGIAGVVILGLVVHSLVRKAKIKKQEREDEKEEKEARAGAANSF